jgi:hypothetical protein
MMKKSNFALRLQPSLMEALRQAAEEDETTLNQYINVAIAEKLATRRTAKAFFTEHAQGADIDEALAILRRAGTESPKAGDERPDS